MRAEGHFYVDRGFVPVTGWRWIHLEEADMTASSATGELGSAFHGLSQATLQYAAAKGSQKVGDWTQRLDDVAKPRRGAAERAAYEGIKAVVTGKNPVWAAVKGGWQGASGTTRALVVVSLTLLLLLSPGVLLLLLLGLLVAAVVAGVRAART